MAEITRRQFLKGAAAGAAAGLVVGAGGTALVMPKGAKDPRLPKGVKQWDADIVVLGGGLAGLAAAVTAAEQGATVILIEKEPQLGGTSLISGGSFSAANSRLQIAKGIEDSPSQHFRDGMRIGKGAQDTDVWKLYCDNAAVVQGWLEDLGLEYNETGPRIAYEHEPYSVARTCDAVGSGAAYAKVLIPQVEKMGEAIQVHLETKALELVRNDEGRVVGVKVAGPDGKEKTLYAKAVINALGGYGSNREMLKKYNAFFDDILIITAPHATGDGHRLCEAVGAKLVHMEGMQPYFAGMEIPNSKGRTSFQMLVSGVVSGFKGDVWVNPEGKRFFNEDNPSPDAREIALKQIPDARVFIIFDENLKTSNPPIFSTFDEEAAKDGLVKKANSIEELAAKIGVNPGNLKQTIDTYNGYCDKGEDPEFGSKELVKIEVPPFYAIPAQGVLFMTQGGVKVNSNLQVVDASNRPIPGLYAAGEAIGCGQWGGDGLLSGTGIGAAAVYGRLAAKSAVAREV
ncbi:MAG: FAD-dependent oxidoreductase [Anaerolineae bacterium]